MLHSRCDWLQKLVGFKRVEGSPLDRWTSGEIEVDEDSFREGYRGEG